MDFLALSTQPFISKDWLWTMAFVPMESHIGLRMSQLSFSGSTPQILKFNIVNRSLFLPYRWIKRDYL